MIPTKNYSDNYQEIIELFRKNLSDYPKIVEVCKYFLFHPDLLHEYITTIDKAIFTYHHFQRPTNDKEELYTNAVYLKELNPMFILPDSCDVFEDIFVLPNKERFINNFFEDFRKMDNTNFFQTTETVALSGTLFIGAYRTYLRVRNPWIIKENVQVASIIEEMLALMALNGEKTTLFSTIKFWMMMHQEEGFSEGLASKVTNL